MKPLGWIGSSYKDLLVLPDSVIDEIGHALRDVQKGLTPPNVKALSGFGGASVLEVKEDYLGDTYRAVYTVRFEKAIFVLHVFMKKSKSGIATPKQDINLIKQRLKDAESVYREKFGGDDGPKT